MKSPMERNAKEIRYAISNGLEQVNLSMLLIKRLRRSKK